MPHSLHVFLYSWAPGLGAVARASDRASGSTWPKCLPASWRREVLPRDASQRWIPLLQGKSKMLWQPRAAHFAKGRKGQVHRWVPSRLKPTGRGGGVQSKVLGEKVLGERL